MWDCPDFLELPERDHKPRSRGLTHVLDKGTTTAALEAQLSQTGNLIDVLKIGWGIAYVDPTVRDRVALCNAAGVTVCLGGTLLEVCVAQGQVDNLRRWAAGIGVTALEVSDGLQAITPERKTELVRSLSADFTVLAETGAKDGHAPVVTEQWLAEMEADLAAGATWVIAEGRESGTVGLYHDDGSVRVELVEAIAARLPMDRVIFETPRKAQQVEFIRRFGAGVNLGNVPPEEVLPLETLRLGLRADTAVVDLAVREPVARR
jgi:phosphosulfolactate synthase